MLELGLAVLTLIGIGYSFVGSLLVLVPNSRVIQKLFDVRDRRQDIKDMKIRLEKGDRIASGDGNIDKFIDILTDRHQLKSHTYYVEIKDIDSIIGMFEHDEREIDYLSSALIQNGILHGFSYGRRDRERGIEYAEKLRQKWHKYADDEEYILMYNQDYNDRKFGSILPINNITNISNHLERDKVDRGVYYLVLGFGTQLIAQFIRVIIHPTLSDIITRIRDFVIFLL